MLYKTYCILYLLKNVHCIYSYITVLKKFYDIPCIYYAILDSGLDLIVVASFIINYNYSINDIDFDVVVNMNCYNHYNLHSVNGNETVNMTSSVVY